MTTAPSRRRSAEDVEGALAKMPFQAAHALARLGWHEAWSASLRRVAKLREEGQSLSAVPEESLASHRARAKEAREVWQLLGRKWADGPRGHKDGAEVIRALQDAAKAAGAHCAAVRLGEASSQDSKAGRADAEQQWKLFEAARTVLKDHAAVLKSSLCNNALDLVWAAGWHAANTIAEKVLGEEEDEEGEEDGDEEEDGEEGDEEDEGEEEEDDEEARFGEEYLGSSDDSIEDMADMLQALYDCFWEEHKWHGVRLDLSSAAGPPAEDVLDAIAAVPGAFGAKGLDAVRLRCPDLAGAADPLGAAARALLLRAAALGLEVVLELPAQPGKAQEKWLEALAGAVAPLQCVHGVALPNIQEPRKAGGLIAALRRGGLHQSRCPCLLAVPGGRAVDGEEEWTAPYRELLGSGPDATELGLLLADGHVLLEAPADLAAAEAEGGTLGSQELLDAASHLGDHCQHFGLVSSWSLAVNNKVRGKGLAREWYTELAQRQLASMEEASRGWFFEAWATPEGDEHGERGLCACLEKGWVDLSAEVQVMQPVGAHKATLVYLHGFACDGNSYLVEPEYFYRPKPKKKKKKPKKGKDKGDEPEDEDEEFEPFPGLKVVLPTAPLRKITCYEGEEMHSWYDYLTDFDGEKEDDLVAEDLEQQTERLHAILDAEAALLGGGKLFLGGGSQGCCVALHAGLTYRGELAGIVGTMGHVLSCTPVTKEWAARKVPVFIYHGLADTTMPWDTWVRPTYARLQASGADVRTVTEEGADHGEQEEVWTRSFLAEALRPAPAKAAAKKKSGGKK